MSSRRATRAALALAVAVLATACTAEGPGPCTAIGAEEGVVVDVPRPLHDAASRSHVRVCDARGCATESRRLGPWPPIPRPLATFHAMGRDFDEGPVRVTVTLGRFDGSAVARRTQVVVLSPGFPNGRACDGDGYLQGSMRLTSADRV